MSTFKRMLSRIPTDRLRLTSYDRKLAISVAAALKAAEMNQSELAERAGMKPAHLSRLLNKSRVGLSNPTFETVARLSAALGTELLEFPVFGQWQAQTFDCDSEVSLSYRSREPISIDVETGEMSSFGDMVWFSIDDKRVKNLFGNGTSHGEFVHALSSPHSP